MTFGEFINKYNIQLNEQQLAAVKSVEKPTLILAVPGSGKTRVLITRLGYMIYCLGIEPESILTLTYTVPATMEMKTRFAEMFGQEMACLLYTSYYVRVRGYVRKGKKKYYSHWSTCAKIIPWNGKWEFAGYSKIHTDSATLYLSLIHI